MSETKVLHEFLGREFNGELSTPCRVIERDGEIVGQVMIEGEWSDAPCEFATEVARLAYELGEAGEKLLNYGWHHHGCRLVAPGSYQGDAEKYCDCGWTAVRAAVEEGK